MVLPLVVGAARVTGTTAKVGAKAGSAAIKTGRTVTRKGARGSNRTPRPARSSRNTRRTGTQRSAARALPTQGPVQTAKKVATAFKKVARVGKGLTMTWWLIWFYVPQLLFAFFAYGAHSAIYSEGFFWGIALELGGREVAQGVLFLMWALNLALGTGLMFVIAVLCGFVYKLRIWRYPLALLGFCVCLWGYWAPYHMLMFVPWTIIWVWIIVFSQK